MLRFRNQHWFKQARFDFIERAARRERGFKLGIIAMTLAAMAGTVASVPAGRHAAALAPGQLVSLVASGRDWVVRGVTGLEPAREETEALLRLRRERTRADTMRSVERFYNATSDGMRHMFDEAGMDPAHCVIGVGRSNDGFLLSSKVFEADARGRSYRLRPNVTSVWLRQVTLDKGPFALFLVPDTPAMRQASGVGRAMVDETSRQTTNSWGLRGPEPDPSAPIRGIVLGDSFMQGMFNDDAHTPPLLLQQVLEKQWGAPTSIVNTGHIGYAPEQYFAALDEYGPRINPQFVVLSVCPNDFGKGEDVILGKGDDWDEAAYWIDEILHWCRARSVPCMLVPAPVDSYVLTMRKDAWYPGRIANLYQGTSYSYCNPFEYFMEEHMKAYREGYPAGRSALFNHQINDNHFSPRGAQLWAEVVGRRLTSLMKNPAQ